MKAWFRKGGRVTADTATPAGIFVYTMLSALAEFERRNLSQRTKEGLQAARRRGKRIGRPPTLTERQVYDAHHRIETAGKSTSSVARGDGRTALDVEPVNPPPDRRYV